MNFFSRAFQNPWNYFLLLLLFVTLIGFYFKFGLGSQVRWFSDYGAAILYEVFFILFFFFLFPSQKNIVKIPIIVLAVTCFLEVLQLWHPIFLEQFRATFVGAALLGNTFVWWDFPHYLIGSALGWLIIRSKIWKRGYSA
ncbi:DUF2809 domain-containing protein [bacterium]|nr:DUF2809 domain-containing protein [bacterium]